jgi:O-antigen ligase
VPTISAAAFAAVAIFALHSTVSMTSIQSAAATSRWAFLRDGLGRGEQSLESRGAIFRESSELYNGSGALGAGPVSTKVRMRRAQAPIAKEAHDDYLAALLERGAVGVAGLVLLIGGLAVRSFSFSTGHLSRGFDRVVAKPHALAGAVAGTFAAAALYEVLHLRHVWALFAFVAAVSVWGRE